MKAAVSPNGLRCQLMPSAGHLFFVGGCAATPPRPSPVRSTGVAFLRRAKDRPDPATEEFLGWLLAQTDLKLDDYRLQPLLRRLPACLRSLRVTSVPEAQQRLERHPELVRTALDTLLLGVTDFFRDPAVFELLRTHVLAELLQKPGPVRIWSAACSDGPELYSVAMQLAEAHALDRSELVGSDCRPSAIMRAAAGVFMKNGLPALSRPLPVTFPLVGSQRVQAPEHLRHAIRWRIVDLLRTALPGPWNLILWRNMAIYLVPEAAVAVWNRLLRELRPGGYLIVGRADHPPRELNLIRIAPCVYQRREEDTDAA